jgi:glucose/arabinose dehydrogenase
MNKSKLLLSPLFLILATCGGGSSSETNVPPQFTSNSALTFVENGSQALQITASDSPRQTLSFSISGGADAARFTISATGALNFTTAPNFESPTDSDADNVYQLIVTASDGQSTTNQSLSITVANSREGIGVRRLFTGFNEPVAINTIPNDRRLIIAEKNGTVWFFDPVTNSRTLFVFVVPPSGASVGALGPNGLLDITVRIDRFSQRIMYFLAEDIGQRIQIGDIALESSVVVNSTENNILTLPRGVGSLPPVGSLITGPDNNLYVSIGVTGGQIDPAISAQDNSSRFGKLIRIRDNPDPFAGATPQPFLLETLAKGLQQPRSLSFFGNDILIGDQGQSRFGEINRIALSAIGTNFGWPFREGNVSNLSGEPAGLTDPALQVAFGTGPKQGRSIIVGQVFASSALDLRDKLLFSDTNGAIWTVPISRLSSGTTLVAADFERRNEDFAPDVGSISGIIGYAAGNDGRAYLLDSDGEVFEVIATN